MVLLSELYERKGKKINLNGERRKEDDRESRKEEDEREKGKEDEHGATHHHTVLITSKNKQTIRYKERVRD